MFKIFTVLKNEKRKMVVIKDKNNKSMYAWIEGEILTIVDLPYQIEDEKLFLTKEDLEKLFPSLIIVSHVKLEWNDNLMSLQTIQINNFSINN